MGCYKDTGKRDLYKPISMNINPYECLKKVKAAGFKYAGLQYGGCKYT